MKVSVMAYLTLAMIVAFISGCSSLTSKVAHGGFVNFDRTEISKLNRWQIKGKLGFKSTDQGGSASIDWLQDNNNYKITLSGPLSFGRAVVTGNHQIANIQRGGTTTTHHPKKLGIQLIGLPLSLESLSFWLRALPAKDIQPSQNRVTNPDGSSASFEQNGWQLSFSNYHLTDRGYLPQKIIGQRGEQSFKLLISQWMFPDT